MEYEFRIQMHLHEGETEVSSHRVAVALERVIRLAMETDIEGAEVLDSRFGQISVTPEPGTPYT